MRILVVDDDPLTLDFLAKKLREQSYAVDTAADGEDGLFKAQSWDYDAIVLDDPGLNAYQPQRGARPSARLGYGRR